MSQALANLQSLFQLSVALNVGFVGYISLFSDDLRKEEVTISNLYYISADLKRRIEQSGKDVGNINKIVSDIYDLKKYYKDETAKIDKFWKGKTKFVILICAAISLLALVIASFPNVNIEEKWIYSTLLLFAPLLYALWTNYSISSSAIKHIRESRASIDGRLTDELIEALPRIS